MAKRKMDEWLNTIWMILGVIALVGIGGLFVNGVMLNVPLLQFLPEVVHTVTGWLIIGLTLGSALLTLLSKLSKLV